MSKLTVGNILRAARDRNESGHVEEIQLHFSGFSEPGYSDPESGIIATGNWNNDSVWDREQNKSVVTSPLPSKLASIFQDRYGVEIEWSDEWTTCDNCNGLIRTQADSYGWKRYWAELDGEIVCGDCIKQDPAAYLESLEGKARSAITIGGIKPEDHGYVKILADLENGFHEGQAADPKVIAKSLKKLGVNRFVFEIDSTGQFDLRFSCWVHEDEISKIEFTHCAKCDGKGKIEYYSGSFIGCHICGELGKLPNLETDAAVSPAENTKQGLQAAAKQLGELTGDGIKYSKINADGTATTRIVSPAEFIEGIQP